MVKLFEMIAWIQYMRDAEVDMVGKLCFYFTFGKQTKITKLCVFKFSALRCRFFILFYFENVFVVTDQYLII